MNDIKLKYKVIGSVAVILFIIIITQILKYKSSNLNDEIKNMKLDPGIIVDKYKSPKGFPVIVFQDISSKEYHKILFFNMNDNKFSQYSNEGDTIYKDKGNYKFYKINRGKKYEYELYHIK